MIVGDAIERNARLYPREIAVVSGGRRTTHAAFAERVRRLVQALHDRGVAHQARVAILAQNCGEYLEVYGAGELGGYIIATVNYRLAPPEMAFVLGDSGATVLVFEAAYAAVVAQLRPQLPQIRHYLCVGDAPGWAESYEAVLAAAEPGPTAPRASADDGVYLIYTSGSTGRPKGVLLGQSGAIATARIVCEDESLQQDDRLLLVMPLYHVGAKCAQLGQLWRGGTIVILPAFEPETVLATIERERVTTVLLAPVMVRAIVECPTLGRFDVSSLRTIVYSAAPMPERLLRRAVAAFGPIFMQHYGMTESGPMGSSLLKHQHVLDGSPEKVRRLASAGQASPTYELRVVDEHDTDCPQGVPGEVLLRGPGLMLRYWNNQPATAEALRGGWLHTGDVGVLDDEQFLFLVDRKKDMVISGGENIYPREVEVALQLHPAVLEVAVIGVPDERWGESVKAIVVLRDGATATADELIAHTRRHIAGYKRPRSIEFTESLPKLPNGKVDKAKLRDAVTVTAVAR